MVEILAIYLSLPWLACWWQSDCLHPNQHSRQLNNRYARSAKQPYPQPLTGAHNVGGRYARKPNRSPALIAAGR